MKIQKIVFLYSIISIYFHVSNMNGEMNKDEYALVIKPVVDVIGSALPDLSLYNNMSYSPINKLDNLSCPRFHQLLFNEIVKILDKKDNEVIIESPGIFFQQTGSLVKKTKFRTLKKNLITFNQLKKFNIDFDKIPKPIDFNQKEQKFLQTITLKNPFKDKKTKKIYSAGTRFVYSEFDDKYYYVNIFNPINHHFVISMVPKRICINNEKNLSNNKKIINFVKILKKWANLKKGFIPYVWGGCSYCSKINDDEFIEKKKNYHKNELHYYDYPSNNHSIKTGFDCSGIILRAAQLNQIPYYFKNSITAVQNLDSIKHESDSISNGDIIWIPGHVIVISDVKNNLMIEATDYSSGYGKVHEIEISKIFKNIKNYDDLKNACIKGITLERLNKEGKVFQTINNLKILKINSAWKN